METRLLSASNHASEQMSHTVLGCDSEHGAVCERGGVTQPIALQCLWEMSPSPPHAQSEILRLRYKKNKTELIILGLIC